MNFYGKAKRLDDVDLPRIGAIIGVGEDEVHAVLDVEARGRGFDTHGRPAMLFEPHIFYRELPEGKRAQAVKQGLARKSWKRDYPKDSYPRLIEAMAIDTEAALRSASWGLGQIMGFNHRLAGFSSAKEMVTAFLDDEETHLEAMIQFILSTGLDDNLRNHDWEGFAKGYNGPGYRKNNYHTKLKAAYEKWAKIPDTEWKRKQATDTTKTPHKEFKPLATSKEIIAGVTAVLTSLGAFLGSVGEQAQSILSVALCVALLGFGAFIVYNRVRARRNEER